MLYTLLLRVLRFNDYYKIKFFENTNVEFESISFVEFYTSLEKSVSNV